MNQRGLQCGLKGEHPHALPLTLEAPLMRLTIASLQRVVKGDLAILSLPFTPSAASPLTAPPVYWDDGRHADPHPHRPLPCGQDPPRPDAREPRVAPSTGSPATHRAASTPAPFRPLVLDPPLPRVARLGGGA